MKILYKYYFTFLFSLLAVGASAQYIQVDDNYTAQQLVDALVGNSCAQVSNVTVSGWSGGAGGNSYGYFTADPGFPFESGIILSSGFAASAPGPNFFVLNDGTNSWAGDAELEAALGTSNSFNATVLEFDFIPSTNSISFDYMFSSEEYTTWSSEAECDYSDGFVFLLKEVGGPSYQNLAIIPNTEIPVKVTSVRGAGFCPSANEEYFGAFNGDDHPTNFNGQTVILTASANVVAGTLYHIKLAIADQADTLYDSAIFLGAGSFAAITELGDDRLLAAGNPLCSGETVILNAANPAALGYRWYQDGSLIPGAANAAYIASGPGVYTVEVQLTPTCVSDGKITLEYAPPLSQGPYTLVQCDDDNDGFTYYNLATAGELAVNGVPGVTAVSYHLAYNDAVAGVPQINNIAPYHNLSVNQKIYVRLQNEFGCLSVAEVTLAAVPGTLITPNPVLVCDYDGTEDGFTAIDLTEIEANILAGLPPGLELSFYTTLTDALTTVNPIANIGSFTNTIAGNQVIYGRVNSTLDCFGIAEVPLQVYTFPQDFTDKTLILCSGSDTRLEAPAGFDYSWNTTPAQNTQSIIVTEPGTYAVTLTGAVICEKTITFTVELSGAATGAGFEMKDFTGGHNSLTVYPVGEGSYEYSLDGETYQESPLFSDLASGNYTVFIKDTNGCNPVYEEEVFVLDYPKFFTPNGDGVNDIWRIAFLNNRPDITVTVFDRYGKIITGFNGTSPGWDGKLNNKALPADDYWFRIQLEDGRLVKGHFSLIR